MDKTTGRLILGRQQQQSRPTSNYNKYRAIKTMVDGIQFASRREAERYNGLKLLLRCGDISDLRLQVKYDIIINGQKVCAYIADFVYYDNATEKEIIEDSKGMSTPVFRLKKKLMKAVLNLDVIEV